MNFLPGQLDGDTLRTLFGDTELPDRLRARLRRDDRRDGRDVIIGRRPEHFHDAALEDRGQPNQDGRSLVAERS